MHTKIAALVLTFNEELNIEACIESLKFTDAVFVYDSFSADRTTLIAQQNGATVLQRKFDNYAAQRNAALKSIPSEYEWILMVDADERVPAPLAFEVREVIANSVSGITLYRIRRKDFFMGKWIKRSSGYPTWFAKLFKNNHVTVERDINEEYVTTGREGNLTNHLIHFPFNKGLEWWFERHNKYSSMEAMSLTKEFKETIPWMLAFSKSPVQRRKFLKQFIYRLPGRPYIIFLFSIL